MAAEVRAAATGVCADARRAIGSAAVEVASTESELCGASDASLPGVVAAVAVVAVALIEATTLAVMFKLPERLCVAWRPADALKLARLLCASDEAEASRTPDLSPP